MILVQNEQEITVLFRVVLSKTVHSLSGSVEPGLSGIFSFPLNKYTHLSPGLCGELQPGVQVQGIPFQRRARTASSASSSEVCGAPGASSDMFQVLHLNMMPAQRCLPCCQSSQKPRNFIFHHWSLMHIILNLAGKGKCLLHHKECHNNKRKTNKEQIWKKEKDEFEEQCNLGQYIPKSHLNEKKKEMNKILIMIS